MAEKVHTAVIQEAYVDGVSTPSLDDLLTPLHTGTNEFIAVLRSISASEHRRMHFENEQSSRYELISSGRL